MIRLRQEQGDILALGINGIKRWSVAMVFMGFLAMSGPAVGETVYWWDFPLKIALPVSWEVMKTEVAKSGAGTQSESFREVWHYHIGPGSRISLSSPRGTVEVGAAVVADEANPIPTVVVITERDFEKLLGIHFNLLNDETVEDAEMEGEQLLMLALYSTGIDPQEFTFGHSGTDYYGIQWVIGQ